MDTLALKERILKTIELHESQFREFKSAFEGPPDNKKPRDTKSVAKDIAEGLVGFANADGGELLVGVEDSGEITGYSYSHEQVEYLLSTPKTGVHSDAPLLSPVALEVDIDDKKILYFAVEKSTTSMHQTADGRCLIRKDRETVPVSIYQLQFERKEQISREYDRQYVNDANVTDLDLELVNNVSQATAHMSPEKCLQYLGLADYDVGGLRLRRGALLLFAKEISRWHPRCQVRVVRVRGTTLQTGRDMNIASDEVDTGNILKLLSSSWERLRPHLVETKLSPDALFREQVMYPEDACREALINAITHRDYSSEGQNIEILIYDDRMEVNSPGALLSTVEISDLKKLSGVHESRNALVARVLREVGYVREMGEGMRRIFSLFRDADLVPPDLFAERNKFSIILHYKSVFSPEDQHWLSGYKRLQLTRDEMLVVLQGKEGQLISPQQIYDLLSFVDWDIYRELIEQLYAKGVLCNTKSRAEMNKLSRGGRSRRDIKRLAIREPELVEQNLSEFYGALGNTEPTKVVTVPWVENLNQILPENNIYKTDGLRSLRLMRVLSLIDELNLPTPLLQTLWSATPQKTKEPSTSTTPQPKENKVLSAEASKRRAQSRPKAPSDGKTGSPLDIYVGNLDYNISEADVFHHFHRCGAVLGVRLPKDLASGKGRGFGFVKMASREDAQQVIDELSGTKIKGRSIRLNWAR